MQKNSKVRAALLRFMQRRTLIRFTRRFEEGFVRGYVLDVGPTFLLMSIQSHEVHFDGFACYRIGDIRGLKPDPYTAFVEAALRKFGERAPRRPRIDVSSIENVLLSARRLFPVITIHRERVDPDVCWIGEVRSTSNGRVSLLEIGPDAKWDDHPTEYKLNEITSIKFGGEYERALYLVGGDPLTK